MQKNDLTENGIMSWDSKDELNLVHKKGEAGPGVPGEQGREGSAGRTHQVFRAKEGGGLGMVPQEGKQVHNREWAGQSSWVSKDVSWASSKGLSCRDLELTVRMSFLLSI